MLARRFTIVCLLVALFAMALSALVANTSRPALSWEAGVSVSCVFEAGHRCALPVRR